MESLGHKIEFEAAPDPSDIVWENLGVGEDSLNSRKRCTVFAMSLFVFTFAILFYILKSNTRE